MEVNQSNDGEMENSVPATVVKKNKTTRPPNGFLGFCHIHRHIVSQRNEKHENRAVTRILGTWWSLLSAQEKKAYQDVTAQYKTLFMEANPGYQWYVRPKSTGNTPVTRQSNRRGRKMDARSHSLGAITPGKLADVSQMGGLSSLMTVEQRKRTEINIATIDEEHNYLKSRPINNNSNSMADLHLQSTLAQEQHLTTEVVLKEEIPEVDVKVVPECLKDEEMPEVKLKAEEIDKNADGSHELHDFLAFATSRGQKMKEEDVEDIGGNTIEKPQHPSFQELLKACPVYSYDEYLNRKERMIALNKRSQTKKHKRQRGNPTTEDQGEDEAHSARAKRKRRSGPTRLQRSNRHRRSLEPQRRELTATITQENIYHRLALLVDAAATVEKMPIDEWIK